MPQNIRIAAVIPAYNEEASIAKVVEQIHEVAIQSGIAIVPVVVNDCSTDQTAAVISNLNCVAINLPINLGIGGGVQTGIKYAFANGFDYAVQIDGDGQHPPKFIPLLLNAASKNNWDVAIGSRFISKEGFQSTILRRSGILYFQWLNHLMSGQKVSDSTSGMRLMNRKTMSILVRYYPDEYPEPEAIIIYHKNGLKFGEVAVEMNERLGGVSSINSSRAVYYMFKVTIAMIFTYFRKSK
ncbi:MAG: glycosyltransferase family 2 protein [Chitinophagales bacterium]